MERLEIKENNENKQIKNFENEDQKKIRLIKKDTSLDSDLFLIQDNSDFTCLICKNIPSPEIAYEVICCGLLTCKQCILNWLNINKKCPICKKLIRNDNQYIRDIKQHNKIFYKTLLKLMLKCPYGCEWKGAWEDLENHLKVCQMGARECQYKNIGCDYFDIDQKIKEHEKNYKLHLELAMKFIKENHQKEKKNNSNNDNNDNNNNNVNNNNTNNNRYYNNPFSRIRLNNNINRNFNNNSRHIYFDNNINNNNINEDNNNNDNNEDNLDDNLNINELLNRRSVFLNRNNINRNRIFNNSLNQLFNSHNFIA